MKTFQVIKKSFFTLLLFVPDTLVAQKEQRLSAPVEAVIVYLDGAEITTTKNIALAAGRNEIVFEGISAMLNPSSIQVKFGSDVLILSISHKLNYLNRQKEGDRVSQLRDSITLVTRKLAANNDEVGAFETEKQMLVNNERIGGSNTGTNLNELKAAADFYRTRIKEVNNRLTDLRFKNDELNKTLSHLNMEMAELNARNSYQTADIMVLVDCKTAGNQNIELKYLVSNAGWAPSYDLKAEDVGQPIELKYNAKVFNNTNVDWKNVKLKLSTADPTQSASKPMLKPWYVDFSYGSEYDYQQQRQQQYQSNQYDLYNNNNNNEANMPHGGALKPDGKKPNIVYEEIEISQLSAEFDIKEKYTVPSDAKPYLVEVTQHKLDATYKHYCIPKVDRDAFLLARITKWESLDLVEGPANIYFGGTFVGQSYIKPRSLDDTLDLSLGRDKKIIVTRTKTKDLTSVKTIGNSKRESYGYEFNIKNNHKGNINIDVIDQLPVSRNTEIAIESVNVSKAGKEDATGELKWNMNIAPGETKKFELAYVIKYPKNKSINGEVKRKMKSVRFL